MVILKRSRGDFDFGDWWHKEGRSIVATTPFSELDFGVFCFAKRVWDAARGKQGQRQLQKVQLSDLWDAFEYGAREMKENPTATERDVSRAADAYVKLWEKKWEWEA